MVWLHGMDHGFISPEELETMQRRPDRPVGSILYSICLDIFWGMWAMT